MGLVLHSLNAHYLELHLSTFKFTPKKGVLANLRKSVRASTATAAVTASNGLRAAPTINKAITDGLDSFNMAVTDVLD